MSKLVLIDGFAILHRAYHAIPRLTSRNGQPTNAVYGLISMLLRIISDLKPTHLAVAFDRSEPTFRKKEFESYQAHRPETDKELKGQFELAREVLGAMGIKVFEKAGFEADDVIGTIASRATKDSKLKTKNRSYVLGLESPVIDEVIIVTGDRDILQLIDDKRNIRLYMPIKGLSEAKLFGEKETKERMGVEAGQIVDYKALVGDPSDNYPGVRGIGPKTAEELLSKFGSFEKLYKWVGSQKAQRELPQKVQNVSQQVLEKLIKSRKDGELSYWLAKIVTDVPIEFKIEKMSDWSVYNPKVEQVFDELGFRTLKERAKKVAQKKISKAQGNLF
jgi:DNA polymerase-1